MANCTFDEMFAEQGFRLIGELRYRLRLQIWWNPDAKTEVILVPLGSKALLKSNKAYYLKAISEDGETWARDVGPLHDYLEAHFPELRLSFSFFRDVPAALAQKRLQKKLSLEAPTLELPSAERLARLQQEVEVRSRELQSTEQLLRFDSSSSPLLQSYVRAQASELRQQAQQTRAGVTKESKGLSLFRHLQKEYEHKGSAACLVFSVSSNTHLVSSPDEFRDALASATKELRDAHRYQVTQKLCGGKLNIYVEEAEEPVFVWLEEWFGGALSPTQLAKLGPELSEVRQENDKHLTVSPDEDIRVGGVVKEPRRLISARVVSSLVSRLDKTGYRATELESLPKESLPMFVGLRIIHTRPTQTPLFLPLARFENCYISGSTGSGKSFFGRVVTEEAAKYKKVNILHLGYGNQAAGLLVPEDREPILSLYPEFGMKVSSARGFKFKYYGPAQPFGEELPSDLSLLGEGRSIVSFKDMPDKEACELFAEILNSIFYAHSRMESSTVRLITMVEEAQRFTKKRVEDKANKAAERAEVALDRDVREGRKYGRCTFVLSQTIKDFAYGSASIRQNTNTKIFMRNSDREIDYAADFIGDGRELIRLPTGTAICHNAAWGVQRFRVRPPCSKVWEFSPEETREILEGPSPRQPSLSPTARRLMAFAQEHEQRTGRCINLSQAGECLGITSKRALQGFVEELERGGLVRTRKLRERGQPRIIEPVVSVRRVD